MKKLLTLLVLAASGFMFANASKKDAGITTYATSSYQLKVCRDPSCVTYNSINVFPTNAGTSTRISDDSISGMWWGDYIGWINLKATNGGLKISSITGKITGYAWSSAGGWINFSPSNITNAATSSGVTGVYVNQNGELNGYAYVSGSQGGWIHFDCTNASSTSCLRTEWRIKSLREKCSNGIDDDGDNLIDEADPPCFGKPLLDSEKDDASGIFVFANVSPSTVNPLRGTGVFENGVMTEEIAPNFAAVQRDAGKRVSVDTSIEDFYSRFFDTSIEFARMRVNQERESQMGIILNRVLRENQTGLESPTTGLPVENKSAAAIRVKAATEFIFKFLGGEKSVSPTARESVLTITDAKPETKIVDVVKDKALDDKILPRTEESVVEVLPPGKKPATPESVQVPKSSEQQINPPAPTPVTPSVSPLPPETKTPAPVITQSGMPVITPRVIPSGTVQEKATEESFIVSIAAENNSTRREKDGSAYGVASIVESLTNEILTFRVGSPNKVPVTVESQILDRQELPATLVKPAMSQDKTLVGRTLNIAKSIVSVATQALDDLVGLLKASFSLMISKASAEEVQSQKSVERNFDGTYTAHVALPSDPGLYTLQIKTVFKDGGVSYATRTILVREKGFIYNRPYEFISNSERVIGARVDLQLKMDDGSYIDVPSAMAITNATGEYLMVLDRGVYRLVVSRPGFETITTHDIQIKETYEAVNFPIEMSCDASNLFGCSRDIKLIVILFAAYFLMKSHLGEGKYSDSRVKVNKK